MVFHLQFVQFLLQYPAVELTGSRLVFQGKQAILHHVFQGAMISVLVLTKTQVANNEEKYKNLKISLHS